MLENNSDFEVIINRWSQWSLGNPYHDDDFKGIFEELLNDTMRQSSKYSPTTRAKLIATILEYADSANFKKYSYGSHWNPKRSLVKSTEKKVYSIIIDLLEAKFEGQEITIDLLGEAPNIKILNAMLDAGIDPNSDYQSGIERFTREKQMFERLIEVGANLELMVNGEIRWQLVNDEHLRMLHKKGINLNVIDKDGENLFFNQDVWREIKLSRFLQNNGIDINHINHAGETALSCCMKEVRKYTFYLEYAINLIKTGAIIKHPAQLLTMFKKDEDSYGIQEIIDFIDFLIKQKISINEKQSDTGNTALHYWASTDSKISRRVCQHLIKVGADINALNDFDMTPLMFAAYQHAQNSWKLLITKKADINARAPNGYSVTEWCIARGEKPSDEFIKLLLDSNAPLNGPSGDCDLSLLGFLITNNYYYCAAMVIDSGGIISDTVINSMFLQSNDSQKKVFRSIADFISATSQKAKDTLETSFRDNIEKLLVDEPADVSNDSVKLLSPQYWPPISPVRNPIFLNNIEAKTQSSELLFRKYEFAEYIGFSEDCPSNTKSTSTNDEILLEKILKQRKKLVFSKFASMSDQAMAHAWNTTICNDQHLLAKRYIFRRFDGKIAIQEYKYILARCGNLVIDSFIGLANTSNSSILRVLHPLADTRLAPIMAKHVIKQDSASYWSRKWLLRHSKHAIYGLIPIAVGTKGKARVQCEIALRYLAENGFRQEIIDIATEFDDSVVTSVNEILSIGHNIDYHIKSLSDLPEFITTSDIKLPRLKNSANPLSNEYLPAILGMMSLSSADCIYPSLNKVLPLFDHDSLADFSWELFEKWDALEDRYHRRSYPPLKEKTAWIFQALAYMGNDKTVKKLVPLINSWPKSGHMATSIKGLDVLLHIKSELSIRMINSILMKTKYKQLAQKAEDIMQDIAHVRKISKEELDDRLVPYFGLDEAYGKTLDFGNRKFIIHLDEKLTLSIKDETGKIIKSLPRPKASDNQTKVKESSLRWKSLKADIKTESSNQLIRYEQAMLNGRRWSLKDFKTLIVNHPLLQYIASNLVWGAEVNDKHLFSFRVGENAVILNAMDEMLDIPSDSVIYIPHPLVLTEEIEVWQKSLLKHKLKQPFAQINRQTYLRKNDTNNTLYDIQDAEVPASALRGLQSKSWSPILSGAAGFVCAYRKELNYGIIVVELEKGMLIDSQEYDRNQKINVTIPGKTTELEYSEIVRELKGILH
jgi:ankyrin repeat protein